MGKEVYEFSKGLEEPCARYGHGHLSATWELRPWGLRGCLFWVPFQFWPVSVRIFLCQPVATIWSISWPLWTFNTTTDALETPLKEQISISLWVLAILETSLTSFCKANSIVSLVFTGHFLATPWWRLAMLTTSNEVVALAQRETPKIDGSAAGMWFAKSGSFITWQKNAI